MQERSALAGVDQTLNFRGLAWTASELAATDVVHVQARLAPCRPAESGFRIFLTLQTLKFLRLER